MLKGDDEQDEEDEVDILEIIEVNQGTGLLALNLRPTIQHCLRRLHILDRSLAANIKPQRLAGPTALLIISTTTRICY